MRHLLAISAASLAFVANASASPCFQQGEYQGMGYWKDKAGKKGSYEVETKIPRSDQSSSLYNWEPDSQVKLDIAVKGGEIFVNGSPKSSGTATCGLAETRLSMTSSNGRTVAGADPAATLQLNEGWLFVGNYLLRHGTKQVGDEVIYYQELLIRKE
jgi:hypothetical protein